MTLAGCWLAVNVAPAHAAGPCGPGYQRVDSHRIPQHGPKAGSIEVYRIDLLAIIGPATRQMSGDHRG